MILDFFCAFCAFCETFQQDSEKYSSPLREIEVFLSLSSFRLIVTKLTGCKMTSARVFDPLLLIEAGNRLRNKLVFRALQSTVYYLVKVTLLPPKSYSFTT